MGTGGSKHAEDAGENEATFDPVLLESLPEELKDKFQNAYSSYKEQFEELESQYDRYRVDSEQKYFELEKQLIERNESLEGESKAATDLRSQVQDLEQKYNESSTKLRDIQECQLEKERKFEDSERLKDQLQQEKSELTQLLDKTNKELDQTQDDVTSLSQKLKESNFAKISAQAKCDEAMSESNIAKSRERRFQHEAEDLSRQKSYLEQQLDDKNRQLLAIHGDHSKQVIDLKGQLELKINECEKLDEMKSALSASNEELNKTLEDLNLKLKESRDMQTDMEERYGNEIAAQEKLINLYKESAEASDNKVNEMTSAVGELQKLLKQAYEANKELENQNKENARKLTLLLEERDEKIEGLQKEVKHANELLDVARRRGVAPLSEAEVEALSPSAAAASRLLKSGMTLTQIYTEYVQASEALFAEKEENKNLNEYMNQILKEIEEKAPMMKKQREDYEKAMEAVGQLTQQLESAMVECEKLRQEADNCRRRSGQASRENQRLKQQTADLGQQVRMLLKELEEAHGTVVTTGREDLNVSSDEVSSSSHLISEKLVSFRSIEELQEQNQKLLGIVRDLSEKKEADENQATELKTAVLKKQLDTALEEIGEMKAARQRQADMVESIVRQRDMFKILLNQTSSSPLPLGRQTSTPFIHGAAQISPGGPGMLATPKTPRTPGPEELKLQEETKAALKELQEEFNMYRKEKNKNEQLLNDQLEKFRKECSELKVQNAKLASQLDFSAERYKILQSNNEGYKKEISALRDKNQKFSTSVIKHEQSINQLRQEAMLAQEKFSHADARLKNMRAERDMLKTTEARLNQEKEGLIREARSQNMLLANLQAIQNNLERSDSELKTKYERRIENLERENGTMKKQLSDADSVNRNVVATLERQLSETKEQKDKEKENGQRMMEELHKTRQSVQQMKAELSKAENRASAAESRLSNVSHGSLQKSPIAARPSHFPTSPSVNVETLEEKVKDLEVRVQDLTKENESLKEQLEKTKNNAEQYKIIADTVEENLKEQNQVMEQFKETTEAKLKEALEARQTAEERLSNLRMEQQELFNENANLTQQVHSSSAELRQQLAKTQAELEEAIERRKQAISNEEAARSDCDAQLRIARESQDKYQRELIMHAADVEALTTVKTELDGFSEKLRVAEEEAKSAEAKLSAGEKTWGEQEQRFKDEIKKTQERVYDLQQQNTVLHEQLEKLSTQMVGVQARKEQENKELAALADDVQQDETSKSGEQLLEVIKFLRKEKEIAEARLGVIQAEANRFKQQNDYLDKQLQDANKALSEEREQAHVHRQTAAQHSEVVRKLETMNLLSDSNKLLRDERDKLAQHLREAETRVNKLEADISPIQQSLHEQEALRENLEIERTALKAEVDRWKARTNHLIEQCNKVDPEEMKKLIEERDVLKRQISSKTEETSKQRAEISRIASLFQKSKSEHESAKQHVTTLSQEKENLEKVSEEKDKNIEEKNKTITQLRRIGQKYKNQTQSMLKELDGLKEKQAGAGAQEQKHAEQVKASEDKIKEVEEKLAQAEENLKTLESEKETAMQCVKSTEEKVIGLEQELGTMKARLGVVEAEKDMVQQALDEKEGMLKEREVASQSSTGQVTAMQEEMKKLKEGEEKMKKDLTEAEKKISHFKLVLVKGQNRIKDMQSQAEKHMKEIAELKDGRVADAGTSKDESEMKFNTLKSQYDATKSRLEKELAEAKKENVELQQKIQSLQKQIGSQPVKAQPQQGASKPTVSAPPVERSPAGASDAPRTANIRPMAGPAGHQSRQSAPVQPVRSIADTRAMASIRPMVPQPTVTPTATVMPTTVSIPDEQPSTQVRRTPQVQPVSPVIDTPQTETVSEVTPVEPVPSTSRTTPPPAAQSVVPSQSVAPSNKRPREDIESSEVSEATETAVKRSRTQETVETLPEGTAMTVVQVEPLPTEVQEQQMSTPAVALVEPTQQPEEIEAVEEEPEGVVEPSTDNNQEEDVQQIVDEDAAEGTGEEPEVEAEHDPADDVVVLASDDEDLESQSDYIDDAYGEEQMGDEQEPIGEYDDGQEYGDEEPYDRDDGMDQENDLQGEGEEDFEGDMQEGSEVVDADNEQGDTTEGDDPVVVVVDDDEEPDTDTQPDVPTAMCAPVFPRRKYLPRRAKVYPRWTPTCKGGQQAQSVPQPATTSQPERTLPPRVQLMRADSRTRAQGAMPPFSLAVPGVPTGTFEEGDDSIVPSTPTLYVPRRTDGFAEAVSSPQVPHGGFTFGASADSGMPGEPLLATQGMDDTRMDLSQFDDGVGRSGPATPRSRSPPTISITEAPTGEADDVEEVVPLEVQDTEAQDSQVPQQQEERVGDDQGADIIEELAVEEATDEAGEDIEQIVDVPEETAVSQEDPAGAGDPAAATGKSEPTSSAPGTKDKVQSPEKVAKARPKIDPIVWTESDTRQFSSDGNNRQTALDGIRQVQQPQRRIQQNVAVRQPAGRRGTFQPSRRGAQSIRGQPLPIPRIGGQTQAQFNPQQQQPQQYMQQRPLPGLMGRGTGGYQRGQRSRGRGGPFRGGH